MWSKIKDILYRVGGKVAVIKDGEGTFVVMKYEDFVRIMPKRSSPESGYFRQDEPDDLPADEEDYLEKLNEDIIFTDNSRDQKQEKKQNQGRPQLRDLPL